MLSPSCLHFASFSVFLLNFTGIFVCGATCCWSVVTYPTNLLVVYSFPVSALFLPQWNTLSEVFRGILSWLLGPLSSKTELLPTSVSGNICLQVPECFAFQPSTCTRADNDLQFLAAILTSLNGATSRGYAVTVILMSKHPGGVLPPLLASCLSPHLSVLPSGASPEMLCLPAGHPFKVSGSSENLTLEEPHFTLLTHFTFIQSFTTIPPTGWLPEVSGVNWPKKMSLQ